jgi:hypothetical protein
MNKYLITYDLRDKTRDYSGLYLAIKTLGPWSHYIDSTWIVKTSLTSQDIWSKLGTHILKTDYLLIVKIDSTDKFGWLPSDAWNWLNS